MNDQLKTIFLKAKLNFAVLAAILLIAVGGKVINPQFTNTVFLTADQLVSDLYIVFIAITLGAFIPNFKLVAFGSIAAFVGAAILIQLGIFTYLTIDYVSVLHRLPISIGTIESFGFNQTKASRQQ